LSLDEKIWRFLSNSSSFLRYGEIKRRFPHLHDQQLTRALRRLEKEGLIIRDIVSHKSMPVNAYLGIDPEDPHLDVRLVDTGGYVFAIIQRQSEGNSIIFHSIDLGEFANYLEQSENGEISIRWPAWISQLAGKVKYEERKKLPS